MDHVELRPILTTDIPAACAFLSANLNSRIPPSGWRGLFDLPWAVESPNHGFQLVADGVIVGVYVAVYSQREIRGGRRTFCNLAAFCVLEDFRGHSFRLLRALLKQKDLIFTDLSPSGNVVALNSRLGFVSLDPATRVAANVPAPPRAGIRVSRDPARLGRLLRGDDLRIYRDHRTAPAAHHILVERGESVGYLVVRRDRRKRLPLFASILYSGGDRELLRQAWPQIRTHLLTRLGAAATLSDPGVTGFPIPGSRELGAPRPRMYKSPGDDLVPQDFDYLYSELALLRW